VPTEPCPGEVWFADLGMVEKSRPVLVLAYPQPADARALAVVAPLTSQTSRPSRRNPAWQAAMASQGFRRKRSRSGKLRRWQVDPPFWNSHKRALRRGEDCVARSPSALIASVDRSCRIIVSGVCGPAA
jgi:hypothetical protein